MKKHAPIVFFVAVLTASIGLAQGAEPRRFSVVDFGAVGDGRSFSTLEIQKAIDTAEAEGGGTVVIPEGVFTSGALFLKPGVSLHLEKGAILRGSTDLDDYPRMRTRIEGHFEVWRPALLNADNVDHLRITGEGAIEGSGQPLWQEFWRRLNADPGTKNLDVERPRLIFIADSEDVVVSGLSLRDSGFWNLHLYRCRNVLIENLDIRSTVGAPSTDGIDIDSSQHVTIRGCFISVDDDCIAIKGSKGVHALEDLDSPPVEHIRVEDCTFGLGHGVVTLGSEATIVRDVVVERIRVIGPTGPRRIEVVRMKLRPDTPQTFEDIHFKDVVLEGVGRLISIAPWTQYFDLKGQPEPSSTVRNVTIQNVTGSFERFGQIIGHERATISGIKLEGIDLTLQDPELALGERVAELTVSDVSVNGKPWSPEQTGDSTRVASPADGSIPTDHFDYGAPLLTKGAPPVRIMPLGDSITYGNRRKDMRPVGVRIAYRYALHNLLESAGYTFDFVGSEDAGERYLGAEMDDNAGFPGITDEQLAVLISTGYAGHTDRQVTPGPYLETHPADIILLHIGTNHIDSSPDDVEAILDNIRVSDPDVTIIIARIINRYPTSEVTTTFNDNVEAMVKARADSRIVMVDMEDGAGIDYYTDMDDDLHPNHLGYDKMAAAWFDALTALTTAP